MDLPFAQRWASKGADKWRKRLAAEVERSAKKKPMLDSDSESDDSDNSDSDSDEEAPKPKTQKPKAAEQAPPPKTAKAAPAKKKAAAPDLLDFASEKDLSSLDSFFADDAAPPAREGKSSSRKEPVEARKVR